MLAFAAPEVKARPTGEFRGRACGIRNVRREAILAEYQIGRLERCGARRIGRGEAEDTGITGVGDVEITGGIQGERSGQVEAGGGGRGLVCRRDS